MEEKAMKNIFVKKEEQDILFRLLKSLKMLGFAKGNF